MLKMKRGIKLITFVVLFVVIPTIIAVPNQITLQGKLTDKSGGAVGSQVINFTFRIYDSSTGGTALWEQANYNISTDANGVYDVILKNLNLSFADQHYLGVTVNVDNESTPRINLTSSPYAIRANTSEDLNQNNSYTVRNLSVTSNLSIVSVSLGWTNLTNYPSACPSGQFVTTIDDTLTCGTPAPASGGGWTDDGSAIRLVTAADLVGIGTLNPLSKLHINVSDNSNRSVTTLLILDHVLQSPSNSSGGIGIGILFRATDNASQLSNLVNISAILYNATNGSQLSAITFSTRAEDSGDGSFGHLQERLRIDGYGRVGINTTTPAEALDINGNLKLSSSNPLINISGMIIKRSGDDIVISD